MNEMARTAESRQPLWIVPASPVIWGAHFLACYATAAVWCGRMAGRLGSLGSARVAIAAYTVVALAGLAAVGWRAYRAHRLGSADPPHDADSAADRHRFIGFAALLLSGLSALAVIYSALPAALIETCQ